MLWRQHILEGAVSADTIAQERDQAPMASFNSAPDAPKRETAEGRSGPDGVMVFDGLCNFCSAQVQFILRADKAGKIRFTAIQSPYGRHLAARFGIDANDPTTFLFFDRGQPLEASEAAIAILKRLPPPWRWLRVVSILPRRWRDALYGFIARNRYRLLGRRAECMVPSPQQRARFIDDVPDDTPQDTHEDGA